MPAEWGVVEFLPINSIDTSACSWHTRAEVTSQDIQGMSRSIVANSGRVEHPVVVRRHSANTYELVTGAIRLAGALEAGLTHIPAVVRSLDDGACALLAGIENGARVSLSPLEFGWLANTAMELTGMSQSNLSAAPGAGESKVSEALQFANAIPKATALQITDAHAVPVETISGLKRSWLRAAKKLPPAEVVRQLHDLCEQVESKAAAASAGEPHGACTASRPTLKQVGNQVWLDVPDVTGLGFFAKLRLVLAVLRALFRSTRDTSRSSPVPRSSRGEAEGPAS